MIPTSVASHKSRCLYIKETSEKVRKKYIEIRNIGFLTLQTKNPTSLGKTGPTLKTSDFESLLGASI
jgi:hypothetical protein